MQMPRPSLTGVREKPPVRRTLDLRKRMPPSIGRSLDRIRYRMQLHFTHPPPEKAGDFLFET